MPKEKDDAFNVGKLFTQVQGSIEICHYILRLQEENCSIVLQLDNHDSKMVVKHLLAQKCQLELLLCAKFSR